MTSSHYVQTILLTLASPLATAHPGEHGDSAWYHTLTSPDHVALWMALAVLMGLLLVHIGGRVTVRKSDSDPKKTPLFFAIRGRSREP